MARASTQRYKNNEPLSIFDGIPITAKDNVKVVSYIFVIFTLTPDFLSNERNHQLFLSNLKCVHASWLFLSIMCRPENPANVVDDLVGPFQSFRDGSNF